MQNQPRTGEAITVYSCFTASDEPYPCHCGQKSQKHLLQLF